MQIFFQHFTRRLDQVEAQGVFLKKSKWWFAYLEAVQFGFGVQLV
jgi:hypothetical protein